MKSTEIKKAFSILKAIKHPKRILIMAHLKKEPRQQVWLKERIGGSQPAIAYHLYELEKIGVVSKEKGRSNNPGVTTFFHLEEEKLERIYDAAHRLAIA
jgi:DNA-binding transcriptional ArsR family regulator